MRGGGKPGVPQAAGANADSAQKKDNTTAPRIAQRNIRLVCSVGQGDARGFWLRLNPTALRIAKEGAHLLVRALVSGCAFAAQDKEAFGDRIALRAGGSE